MIDEVIGIDPFVDYSDTLGGYGSTVVQDIREGINGLTEDDLFGIDPYLVGC